MRIILITRMSKLNSPNWVFGYMNKKIWDLSRFYLGWHKLVEIKSHV